MGSKAWIWKTVKPEVPYFLALALTAWYRLLMAVNAVETLATKASKASGSSSAPAISGHWLARSSPGAIADAVWHAHLDSDKSYKRACRQLLLGQQQDHARASKRVRAGAHKQGERALSAALLCSPIHRGRPADGPEQRQHHSPVPRPQRLLRSRLILLLKRPHGGAGGGP